MLKFPNYALYFVSHEQKFMAFAVSKNTQYLKDFFNFGMFYKRIVFIRKTLLNNFKAPLSASDITLVIHTCDTL